jgi:hypothetical protein
MRKKREEEFLFPCLNHEAVKEIGSSVTYQNGEDESYWCTSKPWTRASNFSACNQEKHAGQKREPKSFMLWFSIQKQGENCLCCPNQNQQLIQRKEGLKELYYRASSSYNLRETNRNDKEILAAVKTEKEEKPPWEKFERVSRLLKESCEGGCPLFILIWTAKINPFWSDLMD